MRRSVLISGIVTVFAILALALSVAAGIFIRRFDTIETAQLHQTAERMLRALEADLNQLAISTRDYAEWDEAYRFIVTRDPAFAGAAFSFETLNGMEVDTVAIFASDASPLYSAELDQANRTMRSPVQPQLLQLFQQLQRGVATWRSLPAVERIAQTERGPLAFSAIEVNRSNKGDPTGAVLLFGRYLDHDEIVRVAQTSDLPVVLTPLDRGEALRLPAPVRAWKDSALAQTSPYFTLSDDDASATSYALVSDVNNEPTAMLSARSPREISLTGRRTTWLLMGAIAALLALGCGATAAMMLRLRRSWETQADIEQRHRNILANLDESIMLADPTTGQVLDANETLLRTLGYRREELSALNLRNIFIDFLENAPATGSTNHLFNCRMRARDGRMIDCEISSADFVENGRPLICLVARDLSQRMQVERSLRENQSRLQHMAEHDPLTGLPNRAYLQTRLPQLLQQAAGQEHVLALLYLDLDHFKHINDSRSHGAGDQLLKVIAQRLHDDVPLEDMIIRTGGDEFVVVTTAKSMLEVGALASRLLASVRVPIVLDDATVSTTVSIGVAAYPKDGLDTETLLKHADIALYNAKERGRDNYQLFDAGMNVELSEHVAIEQALRHAIGSDQIFLEYQPVIDLHTGMLTSFEALARWRHPEMGLIPPGRFIPVAEKSGLIVPLGEQILHAVAAQLSEWRTAGVPLVPIAVNVAPLQFERTDFSLVAHELELQYDLDPHWLSFEVTESAWMQNSNKHIVAIDSLRYSGSHVYIDDFGTGFSNLSYLKNLPIDAVKIDQAFVRNLGQDASDAAIVSGIVAMAQQLNLDTIAEGIETAEQAEHLRMLGCRRGQGYYFSKPVPASMCRALLEQMGEIRRFSETVVVRAQRITEMNQPHAPAA